MASPEAINQSLSYEIAGGKWIARTDSSPEKYILPPKKFNKDGRRFVRTIEYFIIFNEVTKLKQVNSITSVVKISTGELVKHDIQLLGCGEIIEVDNPKTDSPGHILQITPFPKSIPFTINR